jgi:hypothetical protein
MDSSARSVSRWPTFWRADVGCWGWWKVWESSCSGKQSGSDSVDKIRITTVYFISVCTRSVFSPWMLGSRPGQRVYDLWWRMWHWDRISAKSVAFLLSVSYHILIHVSYGGWTKGRSEGHFYGDIVSSHCNSNDKSHGHCDLEKFTSCSGGRASDSRKCL